MKDRGRIRWLHRQRPCLVISCIALGALIVISQRINAHPFLIAQPTAADLTLIVPTTFQDYQCYSTRFFSILYNDIIDPPDEIIFVVSQVPPYASPQLAFPPPPPHLENRIKVLSFQSKQSASQNRNIGAYVATGKTVTFFDIDDHPHPQRFQIIRKVFFEDNPHIDAALFNYVNGTHADGIKHKFQYVDIENLPQHYDVNKLKTAYRQYWKDHPEFHLHSEGGSSGSGGGRSIGSSSGSGGGGGMYFELYCCRPVDKYMANGWGTYRRNVFLRFKYQETLESGEDTDLNARLIFSEGISFTFFDIQLGFYEMWAGVDSDGDPELKGKSALHSEKITCPFSPSLNSSKARSSGSREVSGLTCKKQTSAAAATCSLTDDAKNPTDDPQRCRSVLFTGCGYSATGFLGKTFSAAGYDVPHECLGSDGTSDWRYSFETARPLPFRHIFMQIRHPLDVVASWYSVQWNFTVEKTWKECGYKNWKSVELDVREFFKAGDLNYLPRDVQALEWWAQSVTRVTPAVECWWKIEDFNSKIAQALCERAGFVGCAVPNWDRLIREHENANSHRAEDVSAPTPTWQELCEGTEKDDTRSRRGKVCERARALCSEFHFENC
jgi:hypothetical protein